MAEDEPASRETQDEDEPERRLLYDAHEPDEDVANRQRVKQLERYQAEVNSLFRLIPDPQRESVGKAAITFTLVASVSLASAILLSRQLHTWRTPESVFPFVVSTTVGLVAVAWNARESFLRWLDHKFYEASTQKLVMGVRSLSSDARSQAQAEELVAALLPTYNISPVIEGMEPDEQARHLGRMLDRQTGAKGVPRKTTHFEINPTRRKSGEPWAG